MALGEIYVRARYDFVTPDILRRRSLQYTGSIFSRHVFPPEEQIVYGNDDSHVKWFINERGFGQGIVQLEMAVSLPSRGGQAVPEAGKPCQRQTSRARGRQAFTKSLCRPAARVNRNISLRMTA